MICALVAARVLAPQTKLATTRGWQTTTLADDFGVATASEDDCDAAMDWLLARQDRIQQKLAARHLPDGGLVRDDFTSSYCEGSCCPLARRGYRRDGRRGTLQVHYGVITNAGGCPVAVSVYDGNTADLRTFLPAVQQVREQFGIAPVVMLGDRSMISSQAIDAMRDMEGMDWVTALKRASIRTRVVAGTLTGADAIGVCVGRIVNHDHVAKHLVLTISDRAFSFARDDARIAAEAAHDGLYIIRTSLSAAQMEAAQCVRTYKSLSDVERAFRALKTVDLHVRPIHHRIADRVRAHIFLCVLACYVEWHLRDAWRDLLFADPDQAAKGTRDPVAPAVRSKAAQAKASHHTERKTTARIHLVTTDPRVDRNAHTAARPRACHTRTNVLNNAWNFRLAVRRFSDSFAATLAARLERSAPAGPLRRWGVDVTRSDHRPQRVVQVPLIRAGTVTAMLRRHGGFQAEMCNRVFAAASSRECRYRAGGRARWSTVASGWRHAAAAHRPGSRVGASRRRIAACFASMTRHCSIRAPDGT